jgi:putative transposase
MDGPGGAQRDNGKEEYFSWMILYGEAALRHTLTQYMKHFHHERNHQGKGNVLLFPAIS